jgi:hypothetical protein
VILAEVRDYVRRRGEVSLRDLAIRFDAEPDALRPMLAHWIRKGQLSRRAADACGGCTQCDPAGMEIYVWGDPAPAPDTQPLRGPGCTR